MLGLVKVAYPFTKMKTLLNLWRVRTKIASTRVSSVSIPYVAPIPPLRLLPSSSILLFSPSALGPLSTTSSCSSPQSLAAHQNVPGSAMISNKHRPSPSLSIQYNCCPVREKRRRPMVWMMVFVVVPITSAVPGTESQALSRHPGIAETPSAGDVDTDPPCMNPGGDCGCKLAVFQHAKMLLVSFPIFTAQTAWTPLARNHTRGREGDVQEWRQKRTPQVCACQRTYHHAYAAQR